MFPPKRIVCLTEETVETLYLLGEDRRIVGVSGYAVRPPRVRREKPRVSAFITADVPKILALAPDLVLTFSDLQADLGRELCRRGVPVYLFNQRSVSEILQTVRVVAALVGLAPKGEALASELSANLEAIAAAARLLPRRPRVFFEEWHEPLISAIRWVSELLEIAGADDICVESRASSLAKGRIFEPEEIARRNPDLVIASWCGRKARRQQIIARPGWERVRAVRDDQLYEVKSTYILQPGPASLTDGPPRPPSAPGAPDISQHSSDTS